jgi:hypothetical protein
MRKAVVSGSWFEGQRLVSPRSWLEPSHPPPPASRRFSVAGRRRSSVRLSRPPWASTPIGVTTRRATGLAALALAIGVVSMLAGTSAVAEVLRLDAAAAAARAVEVSDLAIAAGKRADAGDAAVSAADAGRWPTVSTSASIAQRSSVPEFQLPFTMPGQPSIVLAPDITTVYSSGLRVQQAILAGGAINAQRRATRESPSRPICAWLVMPRTGTPCAHARSANLQAPRSGEPSGCSKTPAPCSPSAWPCGPTC